MRSYNDFKPKLVESNRVGTIPKLRKNLLAFSTVAVLLVGTTLGSVYYTKHKNDSLIESFNEITQTTEANNAVITANLNKYNDLIVVFDEDTQTAILERLEVLGISEVPSFTADYAFSLNEQVAEEYKRAKELINNSPFRLAGGSSDNKENPLLFGSSAKGSKEYYSYQEALKTPVPYKHQSEILEYYKPQAFEGLTLSFNVAEQSQFVADQLQLSANYMKEYDNLRSNITNVLAQDGYSEKESNAILSKFDNAINKNRAFFPILDSSNKNGIKIMKENSEMAKRNHDIIMQNLDENRPKIAPKPVITEVKTEAVTVIDSPQIDPPKPPVEAPKAQAPKVEAPKPAQAPRKQQSSVPSW